MCLSIKLFSRKQIATKDIEVVKVLMADWVRVQELRNPDSKKTLQWLTPYRRHMIDFNELLTAKLKRSVFEVNAGIHSYASLDDGLGAIPSMNAEDVDWFQWTGTPAWERRAFKAIIPKGAEYYFGTHHYSKRVSAASYASNQLIILPENF